MKTSRVQIAALGVAVVAVAAAAVGGLALSGLAPSKAAVGEALGPVASAESSPAVRDVGDAAEIEILAGSLRDLAQAVAELTARIERLEGQRRDASDATDATDATDASRGSRPVTGEPRAGIDAHEYLELYVASFADGGGGDEFYRLAVQAHVVLLRADIIALVGDRRQDRELRARLAEMLGDARFRGDARVVDVLFGVLLEAGAPDLPPDLAAAALQALAELGDPAIARRLAALAWSVDEPALRQQVLLLVVRLGGLEANGLLWRLFASATTDDDRILVLTLLATNETQNALDVIRSASLLDHAVRLAAANKVGSYHDPAAVALIDAWLGYEREDDVRAALGESRDQALAVPSYHALQATGPADADLTQSDDRRAWACAQANMGAQWLELSYHPAVRASGVRVFEINGGAVTEITLRFEAGGQQVVWPGGESQRSPGEFAVLFEPTTQRVSGVRVVIDSDRPGWNEIDAVEVSGPDGSSWATHAVASSNYNE